jgi:ATP-dependent RNA helicase DDX24/MAK5
MAEVSSKDGEERVEVEEEDDDDEGEEDDESDDGENDDPPTEDEDEVLDAPLEAAPDTDMSAWSALNLSPALLSAISHLKFSSPTAIQSAAIPEVLAGRDVIGKASTGSGKTLAFALPIIERWLQDRATASQQPTNKDEDGSDDDDEPAEKIPTALILSPTRELAHQLVDHIKAVCKGLAASPYVCSVTGGLSVLKQQRQIARADIVIATPGRLWEVISTDIPLLQAFKQIKFLVVDEADRLLSEGHFKEAKEILEALDREEMGFDEAGGNSHNDNGGEDDDEDDDELTPRQTLVFSATFNKSLQQKLAGKGKGGKFNLLNDGQSMEYLLQKLQFREEKPKFIDVNPVSQMAENLKEGLVECDGLEKVGPLCPIFWT